MTLVEGLILLGVIVLIGVAYAIIEDSRKKGMPVCGKSCGGCPHPCHSDGTPREEPPHTPPSA